MKRAGIANVYASCCMDAVMQVESDAHVEEIALSASPENLGGLHLCRATRETARASSETTEDAKGWFRGKTIHISKEDIKGPHLI